MNLSQEELKREQEDLKRKLYHVQQKLDHQTFIAGLRDCWNSSSDVQEAYRKALKKRGIAGKSFVPLYEHTRVHYDWRDWKNAVISYFKKLGVELNDIPDFGNSAASRSESKKFKKMIREKFGLPDSGPIPKEFKHITSEAQLEQLTPSIYQPRESAREEQRALRASLGLPARGRFPKSAKQSIVGNPSQGKARRNPDGRYRVMVPANGWVNFYVNASSAEEAIELVEAGEYEEELTEFNIDYRDYQFGEAVAEEV